jgi:hypothetical protein
MVEGKAMDTKYWLLLASKIAKTVDNEGRLHLN